MNTRYQTIHSILNKHFAPVYLQVDNESNQHNVPENSETHFSVTLVSEKFDNTTRIQRHRAVNELLADEFTAGLHALSLHLFTPAEWEEKNHRSNPSPACRGGLANEKDRH